MLICEVCDMTDLSEEEFLALRQEAWEARLDSLPISESRKRTIAAEIRSEALEPRENRK